MSLPLPSVLDRYLARFSRFMRLRVIPRSLLARSLLIIVTPLVLLQMIMAVVFYERHWETVSRRLANNLTGNIETVIAMAESLDDPAQEKRLFQIAHQHMQLQIRFMPLEALPTDPEIPDRMIMKELADALHDNIGRPFVLEGSPTDPTVRIKIALQDKIMHITVPQKRFFSQTTYVFAFAMTLAAVLLFVIATLFMRNQVRPVHRLAAAAERFGKGLDVEQFKPEGASEVRRAAQAFVVMRNRIKRQVEERTRMLAGVSHDLRTPLTRMKLALAMMPEMPEQGEIGEDIAEMERMIDGYLSFAKGATHEPDDQIDLAAFFEDIVKRFKRADHAVFLTVEEKLGLTGRPHALERAISNLLSNAVRYGKKVSVIVSRRGGDAQICIDDDGPGIPPERREDVFKAFNRLDNSRNQNTGGVGLGLTITRDVIHRHGGEIFLEQAPTGGLRARLILPL